MLSLASLSLLVASALILYRYVIYPSFISPLSKIPSAHFTASWSPLWILWIRYSRIEVHTIHQAHVQYGPIVRLGPNEISVNCVDGGLRTIYGGGFEKPDFYNQFQNYGVLNTFSTLNSKPHSVRKRMLSNIYSKSVIQSSNEVQELTRLILFDRLFPVLDAAASNSSPLDAMDLADGITMDFITAHELGSSNSSNFVQDAETRQRFRSWFNGRTDFSFWEQEVPSLTRLLSRIGLRPVPRWVDEANQNIDAWMLRLVRGTEQSCRKAREYGDKATGTRPVVYSQLAESIRKGTLQNEMSGIDEEIRIASEFNDHAVAGMDTSGTTLTFLLWELSRHPELQVSIRKELLTLSPTLAMDNSSTLPSPRSLEGLPLLHAVLMETLRLHTAIPGSQPRLTPSIPASIAGSPPLPTGVRVSAQAHSLHRNEKVFPDAETWLPRRWLDASPSQAEEMMRWFWAFGSGSRMCIGIHFAKQELWYVTAAIYTNFTTSIVDDSGLGQEDAWTARPIGNLTLKFTRV